MHAWTAAAVNTAEAVLNLNLFLRGDSLELEHADLEEELHKHLGIRNNTPSVMATE